MVRSDVARIVRAPGRLIVNPVQEFATGQFPFGGAEIGRANACALTPMGKPYVVEYESTGNIGDILEASHRWLFTCFLRGADDDAMEQLLGDWTTVGETQHRRFEVPGSNAPGASALPRAVRLALIPDDTIHSPGIVIYRAVPILTDGVKVAFTRSDEFGWSLAFECVADDTGRTLQVGRIADLDIP